MKTLGTYSKVQNDEVQALLDERAGIYEKLTSARRILKEKQQLADDPDIPMAASRRAEVERAKSDKLQEAIDIAQPRFEALQRQLADMGYLVMDTPQAR